VALDGGHGRWRAVSDPQHDSDSAREDLSRFDTVVTREPVEFHDCAH
jgi:hypothetical protein